MKPMANLRPLLDAINGLPDERTAARQIATWTVLPTAITGILGGAVLTPQAAGFGVLLLYGAGGGVLAAAVTLTAVMLAYRLFGFRAVVRTGEAVFGLLVGFFAGATLSAMGLGWWPLLLAPAFAVLNVVFRPFTRPRRPTPPVDKPLQPGEWERKEW
jgi:hypothetical protein